MSLQRKILGFSDSRSVFVPDGREPVFFRYLLSVSPKPTPVVYYIGAAKACDPERTRNFLKMSADQKMEPRVFDVFNMPSDASDEYFADADIIFIDGGVTRNLLALLNEWDATQALIAAYNRGVVISGASAGISMFFEQFITDSIKTDIRLMEGLGVLPGTISAHFDTESNRRVIYDQALANGEAKYPAYGMDEGVCALFVEGQVSEVHSLGDESYLHTHSVDGGWKIYRPEMLKPEKDKARNV